MNTTVFVSHYASKILNSLPDDIKYSESVSTFDKTFLKFFF